MRTQESQYARSLIEASLDPLVTISAKGKITDVNEASIKVTGVSRENLIGTDFSDYFTEAHKAQEGYQQVLKEGFVTNYPLTIRRRDGKLIDVLYNASVYKDTNGNVLGIFAAARDVTASKQASQYARSLIEASLDPLVTISSEGKITDVNEATIKVTGVSKENLIGTDFLDYFTEANKAREGYQQVLKEGFVTNYPLTIRRRDGKLIDVLYNASVYKDSYGNVLGIFAAARDVTESKQASQYARSLIEASLDPLVTISSEGKITDVNEATIKVTGVAKENLIGTDFSDYFTEANKAREGYQQVLKAGFVTDYPLTIRHKDGKLIDVLYNASVYKDNNGNVLGIFAAARDVTESKQASQYARSLIEASLDPLVTISSSGKITDVNEATIKVTGVSKENLIGTDFSDYFTEANKAREGYQQVLKEGFVTDYPLTIRRKDGKLIDVLYNASVYKDNNGNVLGIFAAARDVTESKQTSQYARSLIEASLDPLVTISSSGKITDVNEATIKVTGISREGLIGSDFFGYFTEPQKAREVYQEVFAKGSVADSPLTLRHKDGKLTDVLFNGSVYKDDRGNVLGVVVVARDITDQKIFENELIEARSRAEEATTIAEEAVKTKQQFLSNMSHEIRTPMNAIIGFTKVVSKTDLTEKQREYIDAIKISGDAMIVLINDILDLAKVDAGRMTFESTPFKLSSTISSMLNIFEAKFLEKNIKLVKEYDKNIPEVLLGDPMRLNQVILNLVSNAIKFTSKGKITVAVKITKEDADGVIIEFSITDTGIGIPENKLETIFDNFQQASSGTSRLYGGTGLGLAIVKNLIEPQGGVIKVESKVGKGSTFSFTLPFSKTQAKVDIETDTSLELDKEIKNVKILVVEDIALNQLLMQTLLEDFGFEMEIAANGKIATEKLAVNTYDIILMDLQMPVMNGFEATQHIRKVMKLELPIIALTADVTTMDVEKCKAVGMNDYISKPIDEKILYRKIIKYLKIADPKKVSVKQISADSVPKKTINLAYLQKLTKNNSARMNEMIGIYLQETPQLVCNMKDAIDKKDWELLKKIAHSIIPSFSTMGIDGKFERIAKQMQGIAACLMEEKSEKVISENAVLLKKMYAKIEMVCGKSCEEIEKEFPSE
ncbi:MAG TPA: PAS domain S-box protein, partial [Cytophagaceae bacterium]